MIGRNSGLLVSHVGFEVKKGNEQQFTPYNVHVDVIDAVKD